MYISIDIEADGPIPGDYSMVSFGAVMIDMFLSKTFYAIIKPISNKWIPEALAISGFSRQETLLFAEPKDVMIKFDNWIKNNIKHGSPRFIGDNNGFDFMFMHWYFIHFLNVDPFGYSSQNIGSIYKGMMKDMSVNFKHLRKSKHTHNALDDAMGNAEAFLKMKDMGLKYDINI